MGLINVENKIVSASMLMELFQKVKNTYDSFMRLSEKEKTDNSQLEEENQRWTFLDKGSEISIRVSYLSGDSKHYHDMSEFISEYRAKGGQMNQILLRIALFYQASDKNGKKMMYDENVSLTISEQDIDISVNLGTQKKLETLYSDIIKLFEGTKVRYDSVIKRRNLYIKLVHNTVYSLIAAGVFAFLFVFSLIDAEAIVVSLSVVGFIALVLAAAVLVFWIMFKVLGKPKTEEQKQIAEENKKAKARKDAAEQEQYEKFAREYGGYYFTRFGKTIYPYRILRFYEPIMPTKLHTTVKGFRVINQWDIDSFIKKSEISIGRGVEKERCRREIIKRVRVSGIALLVAAVSLVLTVLIVLLSL